MLFTEHKKTLAEHIIYLLDRQSLSGTQIVQELLQAQKTSKESIYRTLRKLLHQEVINKAQKKYSLNRHWIQRMHEFSMRHIGNTQSVDAHSILQFNDGDSITYQFKNPDLMGIYWGHLYDCVMDIHPQHIPILIYHPHEWLIHTRTQSEEYTLKRFEKDQKLVLFSIGGNTELDRQFKKDWSGDYLKININSSINGLKQNRYINVLGDFIFEVRTTVSFENAVDDFFKKNKSINESNKHTLEKIIHDGYRTKLIFSRNQKKAELWRKKLSKDFALI